MKMAMQYWYSVKQPASKDAGFTIITIPWCHVGVRSVTGMHHLFGDALP
jgi:hypothetical protein